MYRLKCIELNAYCEKHRVKCIEKNVYSERYNMKCILWIIFLYFTEKLYTWKCFKIWIFTIMDIAYCILHITRSANNIYQEWTIIRWCIFGKFTFLFYYNFFFTHICFFKLNCRSYNQTWQFRYFWYFRLILEYFSNEKFISKSYFCSSSFLKYMQHMAKLSTKNPIFWDIILLAQTQHLPPWATWVIYHGSNKITRQFFLMNSESKLTKWVGFGLPTRLPCHIISVKYMWKSL